MSEPRLVDVTGRLRFPAATPGHSAGYTPANKGRRYPADPPTVEEIIIVMRQTGAGRYADRTRALIAILWRAGLRISEALALTESDLDPKTGTVLVRSGKGGKRRVVGMDDWGLGVRRSLDRGSSCRSARCSASSPDQLRAVAGRRPPHAESCADLPRMPGCDAALRATSSGTCTRSRWPTRGSRCRSFSGNSGMHTSGSPVRSNGSRSCELRFTGRKLRTPRTGAVRGVQRAPVCLADRGACGRDDDRLSSVVHESVPLGGVEGRPT